MKVTEKSDPSKHEFNWAEMTAEEELKTLYEIAWDYIKYGIPGVDKKGHSEVIGFRVRPMQNDISSQLLEKMPPNWFRNRSEFNRAAYAIGCMIIKQIASHQITSEKVLNELDDIMKMMTQLNLISRKLRRDEMEQEIKHLEEEIKSSSDMDRRMELIGKLKEVRELHREVI